MALVEKLDPETGKYQWTETDPAIREIHQFKKLWEFLNPEPEVSPRTAMNRRGQGHFVHFTKSGYYVFYIRARADQFCRDAQAAGHKVWRGE